MAVDGDGGAGGNAHEGIAAPAFAALGAFEEEEVGVAGGEAGQHGDGGFGVGEDAGADGDDGSRAEQGGEIRAGREGFEQHVGSWVHRFFWGMFLHIETYGAGLVNPGRGIFFRGRRAAGAAGGMPALTLGLQAGRLRAL